MNVLLVLPEFAVTAREVRRCRRSLELGLNASQVTLAAARADLAAARGVGEAIEEYEPERALQSWDRIAFIEKNVGRAHEMQRRSAVPVYRFDFGSPRFRARVLPVNSKDNQGNAQLSAHLFNRLASDKTDILYFFPHGYLYRQLGVGPLDDFGHRIAEPLDMIEARGSNERLVVVLGGSGAWSPECLHCEMFACGLEEKLNKWAGGCGSPLRFRVLNFGQHGHVVLNELHTFSMFCLGLRPDVVIAHDGYNDFVYGLTNDTRLLGKHRIAYQDTLEEWSELLQEPWDKTAVRSREETYEIRNTVEAILRAYVSRKSDLERVVTSLGSHFVWGLQPCSGSKAAMSEAETAWQKSHRTDKRLGERLFHAAVPRLYQSFVSSADWLGRRNRVDCHDAFSKLGSDVDHFVDHVHCSPEGDAVIADCYFDYLRRVVFSEELARQDGR